jgi:hypothetical protein
MMLSNTLKAKEAWLLVANVPKASRYMQPHALLADRLAPITSLFQLRFNGTNLSMHQTIIDNL